MTSPVTHMLMTCHHSLQQLQTRMSARTSLPQEMFSLSAHTYWKQSISFSEIVVSWKHSCMYVCVCVCAHAHIQHSVCVCVHVHAHIQHSRLLTTKQNLGNQFLPVSWMNCSD